MSYYFPGPISSPALPDENKATIVFGVNSGENALRLILRSYNLNPGAIIAMPQFVCDSVKSAVIKEDKSPLCMDTYPDSYWTNYDKAILEQVKPSALILVHLYGFIHPDTDYITEYCKTHKIRLIHDLAQSFGVNEAILNDGDIFYSFGPGKSTTAAGGGLIKQIDKVFYENNVQKPGFWTNEKASLFMKSRIYRYRLNLTERWFNKLANRFSQEKGITSMTPVQKRAAAYVMELTGKIRNARKERYAILAEALKDHQRLSMPYDDDTGLYFKLITLVKDNVQDFLKYLEDNKVPYFCLFNANNITIAPDDLKNFRNSAYRFTEISSEATIPMDEIKRVAAILKNYR